MVKFGLFSIIADGWLPLRSSEGLSSSLLRCSVISDHLRVGSRLKLVLFLVIPETDKQIKTISVAVVHPGTTLDEISSSTQAKA